MKKIVIPAIIMLFLGLSVCAAQEAVPNPGNVPQESEKPMTIDQKLEQAVTLNFTKADLQGVLALLARTYDLNVLVDEDIEGTVNISLADITLKEALESILELNDYSYKIERGIIKITEMEEEAVSEIVNVNFVDLSLASEIVTKFLSEDTSIKINDKTNQLIITDTHTKIEKAREFLKKVDVPPRQIMIEAKLIDVTITDLDNLGIEWATTGALQLRIPTKWAGQHSGDTPLRMTSYTQNTGGTSSDLTNDELVFGFTKGGTIVTATINALVQQRKAKVLASPTITTINNVEASITIGEKYPIREQTQTTTGTLETTRFVDIGTTLRVTPMITDDGYVQMTIHPEVSSFSSSIDDGPRITTREADATVILKDRQTLIMAGLVEDDESEYRSRIPILGYLPLIGNLFSSRHKNHDQKELVILVTPYILPSGTDKPFVTASHQQEIGINEGAQFLYELAEELEQEITLKARKKETIPRLYEAAMSYKDISGRFPLHPLADKGLYKAGLIYYKELKDYSQAEGAFKALVEDYPNSKFADKAKGFLSKIDQKKNRKFSF